MTDAVFIVFNPIGPAVFRVTRRQVRSVIRGPGQLIAKEAVALHVDARGQKRGIKRPCRAEMLHGLPMIASALADDPHQVVRLRGVRRDGHRLRGFVLGFTEMPLLYKRPYMGRQRLHPLLFIHAGIHLLSFLKRLYDITDRVGVL